VLEAPDGKVALELARTASPDLLVLDVMLPLRSGFDVFAAHTARRRVVGGVVMLTARDDASTRVAGLELGADDYVTKPFRAAESWPRGRCCGARPTRAGSSGGGRALRRSRPSAAAAP